MMRIYKKNKIKTNIIILKFNFDIEDLEFKEEILAHSVLQVTLELKGVYDIGYKRFDFAIWIDRYLIYDQMFFYFFYTPGRAVDRVILRSGVILIRIYPEKHLILFCSSYL